jgi:metallo-beta-lactamase family protein
MIRIFNDSFAVKAKVETLGGFSAHAGQRELVEWITQFKPTPNVVLVHGDALALDKLSFVLWDKQNINSIIPTKGQAIAF